MDDKFIRVSSSRGGSRMVGGAQVKVQASEHEGERQLDLEAHARRLPFLVLVLALVSRLVSRVSRCVVRLVVTRAVEFGCGGQRGDDGRLVGAQVLGQRKRRLPQLVHFQLENRRQVVRLRARVHVLSGPMSWSVVGRVVKCQVSSTQIRYARAQQPQHNEETKRKKGAVPSSVIGCWV